MVRMIPLVLATTAALPGDPQTAEPDMAFEIRIADDPPVALPTSRFSVRQMNAIHFKGRYYAYKDVVPWDSPHHPDTYHTSVHAYSSDDGLHWGYEGEVLPIGRPGEWDAGGVATPGACVAEGQVLLAYSGREREDGSGRRSIGLAVSADPLGPFARRPAPILTAEGHLDDPLLVTEPGSGGRVLLYHRLADPRGVYTIRLAESEDAGKTWGTPTVVLSCHGDIRAMETLDAKWFGERLVLAQVEHFREGRPMKVALYVSSDGRSFTACRRKYLNDYLSVPLRFAFGPIVTFIPEADGRIEKIALSGYADGAGHYTQWVYRLMDPGK